ncbi:MAG TPA: hypothetical protein PKG58_06410, partial [Bacillota bacterium]|nr:hypothetical protein [Bacillota bacterium]
MKSKKFAVLYLVITSVMFMILHADIAVPETIRIGLSFGQSQANIFTLASETGMNILILEKGSYKNLLEVKNPKVVKVRRDEYYNI